MPDRILVIRLGQLGDVLLCSPLILNLKLNFPGCHITFLTKRQFAPLAERIPGVDSVIGVKANVSAYELYCQAITLDEERYDTVIDLQRKVKSWFVRKLLRPDKDFIYPKRRAERRQTVSRRHKIIPKSWPHTIDLYNEVLSQMGGTPVARRPLLSLTDSDLAREQSDFKRVFIAPGASYENKNWGFERFAKVARNLIDKHNAKVYWAVTKADWESYHDFDQLKSTRFELLIDQSIDQLISTMTACDVGLSNDSGLMHLATAVGLPLIGLFGPTHQSLGFAPRGIFSRVIEVDLACRPCSLHGSKDCYRDARYCFDRITPQDVIGELLDLYESRGKLRPALFVDRDGTLIVDKDFLSDPDQVELLPGVPEALKVAAEAGYQLVMISNQSGVARGLFSENDVELVNRRVMELLAPHNVEFSGVYYCPFYENGSVPRYSIDSPLRKPRPGMVEVAAEQLNLDLRRSIVIGDKHDDFRLGQVIGGRSALVLTGHGFDQRKQHRLSGAISEKNVYDDLLQAVQGLVTRQS